MKNVRILLAIGAMAALPALAHAECKTYSSELHQAGEKTITFDGGALVVSEKGTAPLKIEHGSVGTGITTRYGSAADNPGKCYSILFASDDWGPIIVIDMEVFRPYCPD